MSILNSASIATTQPGIRAVISGVEGIGKTTLACNAPRVLLIPLEAGSTSMKVMKVPMLEHFEHVMSLLDEIMVQAQQGAFPYKTIVFDSATALERLIHQAVLMTDPIYVNGNKKGLIMDNALGGYGKAYNLANEMFGNFLKKCDDLATKGSINIVMTCHVFSGQVLDPVFGEYNTMDLLLHSPKNQKNYGKREMLTQWADLIGFLHEPIFVTEGKNQNKGISANQGHVLAVARSPGYVAKNRFNMTQSIAMPRENGWNYLAQEVYANSGFDIYNRDVIAKAA